jgi:hypothetical protein
MKKDTMTVKDFVSVIIEAIMLCAIGFGVYQATTNPYKAIIAICIVWVIAVVSSKILRRAFFPIKPFGVSRWRREKRR